MKEIELLVKQIKPFFEDDEMEGYRFSPYIKQLIELLENSKPSKERVDNYLLIGDAYKKMGRFSLAASYHEKALDDIIVLKVSKGLDELFYSVLRERNFYVDDDCKDVLDQVKESGLLDERLLKETYENVMNNRRSLRHDPVEMSEEYLAVIDEVEEKIAKNRTFKGMGSCHEIWSLKWQYLLEKGINWKSPSMLNPRVMFD